MFAAVMVGTFVERQARSYSSPVKVDEAFLNGVGRIIGDAQGKIRRAFADEVALTLEQIEAIERGEHLEGVDSWRAESRRTDLQRHLRPDFALAFKDGSTVQTSNLEDIRSELAARAAEPESLNIDVGASHLFRLHIEIRARIMGAASVTIQGNRANVRDIDRLTGDLIENAEPDYAYLYTRKFSAITGALTAVIVFASYWLTRSALMPGAPIKFWTEFAPNTVVMLTFSTWLSARFDAQFPKLQFAYGRSSRRREGRRAIMWQCICLLIIPIALAVLQARATGNQSEDISHPQVAAEPSSSR